MNNFRPQSAVIRTEDSRFLTGAGKYIDDINLPKQLFGYMLRSPHANARIQSIDTNAAKLMPGVIDILIGEEYLLAGLGPLPHNAPKSPDFDPSQIFQATHYPLAKNHVRYVGDGVAFIVAEKSSQAKDAAERIVIEYQERNAVVDLEQAISGEGNRVWNDCPQNIAYEFHEGDQSSVESAFKTATHAIKGQIRINRLAASPIEPRGVIADYNPNTNFTTVYLPTQGAFGAKNMLANLIFKQPAENFRVITGDVGGSFGMKGAMYPETPLAIWATPKHGRPEKGISARTDAILSDCHARDKIVHAELALDEEYNFLAVRVHALANTGAYYSTMSTFPIIRSTSGLAGAYKTPAIHYHATAIFTNSNPMAPYRGSGRPDAGYIIERIIDIAARKLNVDPIELRYRNLLSASDMPFKPALGPTYDSGDFISNQKIAIDKADIDNLESRRKASEKQGKLLGFGIGNNVESAAPPGQEWAKIEIGDDGSVALYAGSTDQGQGHATMYTQIICQQLELPPNKVRIVEGDTNILETGFGAGGSKVSGLGGSAVYESARKIAEKAGKIAARELEVSSSDIVYHNEFFSVTGTDKKISLGDVAKISKRSDKNGLSYTGTYKTNAATFPSGCHVCELEVDIDSGEVKILKYIAVTDVGNAINPAQVNGQIRGGVVQAWGQVFSESIEYSPETGQLMSGSFMDYAMPKAIDMCSIETYDNPTKTSVNPIGVKGAGEIGTGCAVATFVNALIDALSPLGIQQIDTPADSEKIWREIKLAQVKAKN